MIIIFIIINLKLSINVSNNANLNLNFTYGMHEKGCGFVVLKNIMIIVNVKFNEMHTIRVMVTILI